MAQSTTCGGVWAEQVEGKSGILGLCTPMDAGVMRFVVARLADEIPGNVDDAVRPADLLGEALAALPDAAVDVGIEWLAGHGALDDGLGVEVESGLGGVHGLIVRRAAGLSTPFAPTRGRRRRCYGCPAGRRSYDRRRSV